MIVLQTIAVAFAMFSALPVPQFAWNEKNMRYALCAFPLVVCRYWCGVVCAGAACRAFAQAAVFALVPVWMTGGIHLDGYADTCDALSSYGDRQKAGNIKRPPLRCLCGHPAVQLFCCISFALAPVCSLHRAWVLWTLALVGERMLSGLAVAAFPPWRKNTGLAHTFATAADRRTVRRVLWRLAAVLWAWAWRRWAAGRFCWRQGWCSRYHRVAVRQFGGTPATLPGGSCKNASFGCWRHWLPANGWGCYKSFYHGAAF